MTEHDKTQETWKNRAREAEARKDKLLSFGPNALGLLVQTKSGLFVVDPEDNFISRSLLQEGSHSDEETQL